MADWNLKTQQQSVFISGKGLSTYDKLYEGSQPNTGLYITGPDGKEYVYVPQEYTNKGAVLEQTMAQAMPDMAERGLLGSPNALVKIQYYNSSYLNPETFKNAYSFTLPDSIKNNSAITANDFGGVSNYADFNKSGKGFLFPADYFNSTVNKSGMPSAYSVAYKNDKGDWIQQAEPIKGVGNVNSKIAQVNGLDASQPVYLVGSKQPDANTATQSFISASSGGVQEKGIHFEPGKNTWFGIGGVIGDVMGGIAQTIKDLGPIGQIGMMYATAGLGEMVGAQLGIGSLAGSAIVNGAMQVAQGKDIEDALTGAAKTIAIGSAAGQVSNSVLGQAAAEKYATDVGSQQTNMLAAQEAGLGSLGFKDVLGTGVDISADLAGRVAGQTAGSVLAGNDPLSALITGGINVAVPSIAAQIPGFSDLDPRLQRAANTVIANELQGKDPSQALINQAIQAGMDAVKTEGKSFLNETKGAEDRAAVEDILNSPASTGVTQTGEENKGITQLAQTQEPPAQGGIEQLVETQPEPVVPPTQQLAQETTGGLDQLINAINNPETTSSYTGTNVADVSGGITGLPSDQPTDQDLAQLGVGLPTGLTDTTDQGGVDVGDVGIPSLLDQGQTGNGYQQGEGAFTGIDTGTVASDQITGGTGMDNYDLGGFEGIDLTGGQGDTYQAGNEEEENISTIPIDAGQGEGAFPGTEPGTVASDQPGGDTGLTPGMWQQLSTATGLPVNTLKLLGAGLGAAGLGSLFNQQQTAPAPTPYTGPLSNITFNPATYTPYTYKPYAGGGAVESMSNANAIGANTGFPMADIQRGAYSTPYQQPISQNVVTGAQDTRVDPYTGAEMFASGGIASLGGYSDGGRLLRGPGDGVSDSIPAMIGNRQPARLADGEFVIPARIVSEIGNGSTDAGARKLYEMMDRVQAARRKTTGKGKFAANTKADKYLPT